MSVIAAFRRLRYVDCPEYEVNLGYIVSSRPARYRMRYCLRKTNKATNKWMIYLVCLAVCIKYFISPVK